MLLFKTNKLISDFTSMLSMTKTIGLHNISRQKASLVREKWVEEFNTRQESMRQASFTNKEINKKQIKIAGPQQIPQ